MSNKKTNIDTAAIDKAKVLKEHLRDQTETIESQIRALRCITGLLNGHNDAATVNVSELSYLIDPVIEILKEINDEFMALFYQGDVLFIEKAEEQADTTA